MLICSKLVTLALVIIHCCQAYTAKIYGGHEAVPHSRPYMALVEMQMADGEIRQCGGFLVNPRFVITAAHCRAKSYTVLLGVHNVGRRGLVQEIPVVKTIPHGNIKKNGIMKDILILKLGIKACLGREVGAIPLADRDDQTLPKSCFVSGWGNTIRHADHDFTSHQLMEVNVTLSHSRLCAENRLYCSKGMNGPAEGDSGAPLVCEDGKAYGVVSSSYIMPKGRMIYFYAMIPQNRAWIDFVLKFS